MRVGSAEVGGLIEIVEWDERARPGLERRSPASTSAGAGACASSPDGRTRVELRFAYGVAGAGILGWIAEQVAAPTVRGHLRRSLQQLKRQVEHERCAAEAARRRAAREARPPRPLSSPACG